MYDDKLNKAAIGVGRWATLFMLFFGYWCLGNKQIFNNTTNMIDYANVPAPTGHFGLPNMGPSLPLFIIGCLMLVFLITRKPFEALFLKLGIFEKQEDMEVDERLGSFFDCID